MQLNISKFQKNVLRFFLFRLNLVENIGILQENVCVLLLAFTALLTKYLLA